MIKYQWIKYKQTNVFQCFSSIQLHLQITFEANFYLKLFLNLLKINHFIKQLMNFKPQQYNKIFWKMILNRIAFCFKRAFTSCAVYGHTPIKMDSMGFMGSSKNVCVFSTGNIDGQDGKNFQSKGGQQKGYKPKGQHKKTIDDRQQGKPTGEQHSDKKEETKQKQDKTSEKKPSGNTGQQEASSKSSNSQQSSKSGSNEKQQSNEKQNNGPKEQENLVALILRLNERQLKIEENKLKMEEDKLKMEEDKIKSDQQEKKRQLKMEEDKIKSDQQERKRQLKMEEDKIKSDQQEKKRQWFYKRIGFIGTFFVGVFASLYYFFGNLYEACINYWNYRKFPTICMKDLKSEVPNNIKVSRSQLNQVDPKKYDLSQVFYKTSVSQSIEDFFLSLSKTQKMSVLYGLPGIGKTQSIVHSINKRKRNGNLIFYLHVGQLQKKQKNKQLKQKEQSGSRVMNAIWEIPTMLQIQTWVETIQKTKKYQKSINEQFYNAFKSKEGVTIIFDQFNTLQDNFNSQQYHALMSPLLKLARSGIKIVLVSSNKNFCLSNLIAAPGIRQDKFFIQQIKSNSRSDFDQMFSDFKFSEKAKKMILDYHYNRRSMQQSLRSYINCEGSEQVKLKAVKTQLDKDLSQKIGILREIHHYGGNFKDFLISVCHQKKGEIPSKEIRAQLKNFNILDHNEFTSKIVMKAFQEFAKTDLGQWRNFKCKSKKFYYSQ